jgi:hypothetical protein
MTISDKKYLLLSAILAASLIATIMARAEQSAPRDWKTVRFPAFGIEAIVPPSFDAWLTGPPENRNGIRIAPSHCALPATIDLTFYQGLKAREIFLKGCSSLQSCESAWSKLERVQFPLLKAEGRRSVSALGYEIYLDGTTISYQPGTDCGGLTKSMAEAILGKLRPLEAKAASTP